MRRQKPNNGGAPAHVQGGGTPRGSSKPQFQFRGQRPRVICVVRNGATEGDTFPSNSNENLTTNESNNKPKHKFRPRDFIDSSKVQKLTNRGGSNKPVHPDVTESRGFPSNSPEHIRNSDPRSTKNKRGRVRDTDSSYDPFSYKRLERLVNEEKVSESLTVVLNNIEQFKELTKSTLRHDLFLLVVRFIGKILSCDLQEACLPVLDIASTPAFIDNLKLFISSFLDPSVSNKKERTDMAFKDICLLYKSMIKIIPNSAFDLLNTTVELTVLTSKMVYPNGGEHCTALEAIKESLSEIKDQYKLATTATKTKKSSMQIFLNKPIIDYKELSVVPTPSALCYDEYIPENLITESYEDFNQYMNCQFRLLREDFFMPLKEGIKDLTSQQKYNQRRSTLWVYRNVEFSPLSLDLKKNSSWYYYPVKFGKENTFKWEYNKRFMFGSLLLFSKDNFNSFFLGVVADRKVEELAVGFLRVRLLDIQGSTPPSEGLINQKFTMIEPKVFFEPYYQVLSRMQRLNLEESPLLDYILLKTTKSVPPSYIPRHTSYQSSVELNDSQLAAYNAVFSNSLVVIQGPPGTGKSFVGIQIVKQLLKQKPLFHPQGGNFIMLVTYTNHALDQFLEGLLGFTHDLVRIGGQSKSPALAKFIYHPRYDASNALTSEYFDQKHRLIELQTKLNAIENVDVLVPIHLAVEIKMFKTNTSTNDLRVVLGFLEWVLSEENIKSKLNLDNDNAVSDFVEHCLTKGVDLTLLRNISKDPLNSICMKLELFFCIRKENVPHEVRQRLFNSTRFGSYLKKLSVYEKSLKEEMNELIDKCAQSEKGHKEAMQIEMARRIGKTSIVGLTTTAASKNEMMLSLLTPKIVIIEEAAEILEAHIVSALTSKCEHLILIGDHQQLQPKAASYFVGKKLKLGVSFFEKLILNNVQVKQLAVQHRMRPEICSLITPSIYPNLTCHPSVMDFPSIKGVIKNLHFFNHCQPEKQDEDIQSYYNLFEVDYINALCKYLILQGYAPEEITVLTFYSAQLYKLKEKKSELIKEVSYKLVDNFQGEENNIILLSLVRSNCENTVGFLSTENRICVSLSRAKHGFFMIGNMGNLSSNSDIWKHVNTVLTDKDSIGPEITLRCQVHFVETKIKTIDDFNLVKEGGCSQLCKQHLDCGHYCTQLCHIMDRQHKEYKCMEPCERLPCGDIRHPCPLKCHMRCGPCKYRVVKTLPCGHEAEMFCCTPVEEYKCLEPVDKIFPYCNHVNRVLCSTNVETAHCPTNCETRLDCGHACTKKCHVLDDPDHEKFKCVKPCPLMNLGCTEHPCSKLCFEECILCPIEVKKNLPCGHITKMKCHIPAETFECKKPCSKKCSNGHDKKGGHKHACYLDCDTYCEVKMTKKIPGCGHSIDLKCNQVATNELCKKACERLLGCSHKCRKKCNEACRTDDCQVIVHFPSIIQKCRHPLYLPCNQKAIGVLSENHQYYLKYCGSPCNKTLPCGDKCAGTCGQCFNGRIHVPCSAPCKNVLVCGHTCENDCRMDCPPCTKPCTYFCVHSRCPKKCGIPCVECKEKCVWSCAHFKCSKKCGELCDRPPCDEACTKTLKCGHPCVGLCGETCPHLCRICDKSQLEEVFFGTEDDEDARFVLLEDCKHVFEQSGLDQWMNMKNEGTREIGFKVCPKCKSPIMKTKRYGNIIKTMYKDVHEIKEKISGSKENIKPLIKELEGHIPLFLQMMEKIKTSASDEKCFAKLIQSCLVLFNKASSKKRRDLSYGELKGACFVGRCLSIIHKILERLNGKRGLAASRDYFLRYFLENISDLLSSRFKRIHNSEMKMFESECQRFSAFIRFCEVADTGPKSADMKDLELSIENKICWTMPYPINGDEYIMEEIKEFAKIKKQKFSEITDEEKRLIHQAMSKDFHSGGKQGHWFKCPNGHTYCITECGGAMQMSRCPECKEVIGGQHHQLVSSSTLDSSMDGARYAAWSNQNNLHNYHL